MIVLLSWCAGWQITSIINSVGARLPIALIRVSPKTIIINKKIASMSLRQKVASLLILHRSTTDTTTLQNYLEEYQPGGIIFMGDNIPPTLGDLFVMTTKLQTNIRFPYLLAIDEEGGVVSRIAADIYLAASDLKFQPVSFTKNAFYQRSLLLRQVGINLNFGIVADITDNPNSFIYQRVFGGNPFQVSEQIAAAVDGANGITLSTLKHFPGHGETEGDSHTSIPVSGISYSRWREKDAVPFIQGVKAGAQFVMFGHLVYSDIDSKPASLSTRWHQILKERVGFTGISVTDDMVMLQQSGDLRYANPVENAVNALKAGNMMLLFVLDHGGGESDVNPTNIIDGIVDAVKSGSLNEATINRNTRRVLELRYSLPDLFTKK